MAIRNVLQFGNPLLRETSIEVTEFLSPEVQKTARNLEDTLSDLQRIHGKGGGLAAPQIGSLLGIVHVNARGRSLILVNPVIVERSDELFEVWDFCFSAGASFLAPVRRNLRIAVEYQDLDGTRHREEFAGYFSELLQHEIDHLDGILFIDRIEKPTAITMMSEWDRSQA